MTEYYSYNYDAWGRPKTVVLRTAYLGNNRLVTDASGSILQTNHYDPYGESLPDGAAVDSGNPYKYSGKEYDDKALAYDFGARHFTTSIPRWTTMDPLAEKYYSLSPYAYCAGNPMNLRDEDGRNPALAVVAALDIAAMVATVAVAYVLYKGITNNTKKSSYSPGWDWQGKQDKRNKEKKNETELKHKKMVDDHLGDPNNYDPNKTPPNRNDPRHVPFLILSLYESLPKTCKKDTGASNDENEQSNNDKSNNDTIIEDGSKTHNSDQRDQGQKYTYSWDSWIIIKYQY